jgi:dUTP pyrophosphatase
MELRFKKLMPSAVIPAYAKPGDAGLDLTAISVTEENGILTYGTGLTVEIPIGYVGLVFPRSSVYKSRLTLTNCVGVIDSGYRGEIMAKFKKENEWIVGYRPGDRICQLIIMPYPTIEPIEVTELPETARGEGGFGSTNVEHGLGTPS